MRGLLKFHSIMRGLLMMRGLPEIPYAHSESRAALPGGSR